MAEDKEGVSIKEIEAFTRKHRFSVVLCAAFILACLFSFAMWGPGLSVIGATVGAVVGILLPEKVGGLARKIVGFVLKHESTVQLILGIVFLVLAVFLAPLYFLILGLHGGRCMYLLIMDMNNRPGS